MGLSKSMDHDNNGPRSSCHNLFTKIGYGGPFFDIYPLCYSYSRHPTLACFAEYS